MKVSVFRDPGAAGRALASGRVQVGMADSGAAAYAVKKARGRFKLAGPTSGRTPRAIAVAREPGMAGEVLDALETLIGAGTYESILARWGAQDGAITTPRINAATG